MFPSFLLKVWQKIFWHVMQKDYSIYNLKIFTRFFVEPSEILKTDVRHIAKEIFLLDMESYNCVSCRKSQALWNNQLKITHPFGSARKKNINYFFYCFFDHGSTKKLKSKCHFRQLEQPYCKRWQQRGSFSTLCTFPQFFHDLKLMTTKLSWKTVKFTCDHIGNEAKLSHK